jgi:guanylate kinase
VLLVVAGPSGVGKGTIVRGLLDRDASLWSSVSANTRPPRPGEREGVDYLFMTTQEFERLRDAGGFLEWFSVYGDLKGTPRGPVEEHLAAGDDVVLEIDVQGALAVKEQFPDAVLVFVRPPSPDELRRRLLGRPRGEQEDLDARIEAAAGEEAVADRFDAVVTNDDVDAAVAEVAGILDAHRRAAAPPDVADVPDDDELT